MKTAEQIIKVLKERYIDAHCNPDFKGDKMEYIFQPLPEQTESKELTDLKQYVTNLLYAALEVNETPFNSSRFDKWVDEHINNLSEYFSQSHQVESNQLPQKEVTDEEIDREWLRVRDSYEKLSAETIFRITAKWMRNKLK